MRHAGKPARRGRFTLLPQSLRPIVILAVQRGRRWINLAFLDQLTNRSLLSTSRPAPWIPAPHLVTATLNRALKDDLRLVTPRGPQALSLAIPPANNSLCLVPGNPYIPD